MELKGVLVSQPWGMMGKIGLAARLYDEYGTIKYDKKIPFGELIVGGDFYNETYVVTTGEKLRDYVKSLHPKDIGIITFCTFGKLVPFVLKVISVSRPTPFLCYPNEEKGCQYHSWNAKLFSTPGGREQLIIALEDFSLLVGFRSIPRLVEVFKNIPEMKYLVDEISINNFLEKKDKTHFIKVFGKLLDALPLKVELAGRMLMGRLKKIEGTLTGRLLRFKLFMKLQSLHPEDVGIFLPYFLHYVSLEPMEALFLRTGVPYTILTGDALLCSNIVENSTKAAFTCKRDVDQFLECVTDPMNSEVQRELLRPHKRYFDSLITEYVTSSSYFRLFTGTVPLGSKRYLPSLSTISILLILEGLGKMNVHVKLNPGSAYCFNAYEQIVISATEKIFYVQVCANYI